MTPWEPITWLSDLASFCFPSILLVPNMVRLFLVRRTKSQNTPSLPGDQWCLPAVLQLIFCFTLFLSGLCMRPILISQKWEAFRTGQVFTQFSIGAWFRGDFIWCWQQRLVLCCMCAKETVRNIPRHVARFLESILMVLLDESSICSLYLRFLLELLLHSVWLPRLWQKSLTLCLVCS